MTTTRFALLVVAVLAGVLTGCSTDTVVNPTSTTSDVVTSAPSATSDASPIEPTPASSTVQTATSDASTATETTPPSPVDGFGLAGQDLADAQAAWDAYLKFRAFYVQAQADPGADWSAQLAALTNDPMRTNAQTDLTNQAKLQSKVEDRTRAEITKIEVAPDFVVFSACIDASDTKFFDKNGNDVTAPDAPGSYLRHPGELWVERQNGAWLFVDQMNDFQTQC